MRRANASIYSRLTGEGSASPIDQWNPEIYEASKKFHIRPSWIKAVMMQESGGHQYMHGHLIRSAHGAVGLMQLKPSTYRILAQHYHLGSDPYRPRNNIMAGTAYMKELYNRFGSPEFLAAYTCGPGCVIAEHKRHIPLPAYARTYMDNVAKHLNDSSLEQTADSYISDAEMSQEGYNTAPPAASAEKQTQQAFNKLNAIAPTMADDADDVPDDNGSYDFHKKDLAAPDQSQALPLSEIKQHILDQSRQQTVQNEHQIGREIYHVENHHLLTIQGGSYSSLQRARHTLQNLGQAGNQRFVHHQIEKITYDNGHALWRVRFINVPSQVIPHLCHELRQHRMSCIVVHP